MDKRKSDISNAENTSTRSVSTLRAQTSPLPTINRPRIRTDVGGGVDSGKDGNASNLAVDGVPTTTLTPPTPANQNSAELPSVDSAADPGIVVSHSGNMISHRRVRSTSSSAASPKPGKPAISAPGLTSAPEAPKPRTPSSASQQGGGGGVGGGFFSSVLSAAQNAATSISNTISGPVRGRTGSQSQPSPKPENGSEERKTDGSDEVAGEEAYGVPSAVDTLGTGDLNFSHLDMDMPPGGVVSTNEGVVITKPDVPLEKRKNTAAQQRDEESAKREGRNAARAVSTAYEKRLENPNSSSAEDRLEVQSISARDVNGDDATPTGSVAEGENNNNNNAALVKRSASTRSRLGHHERRHRGSSGATNSTSGAIGASAIAMGIAGINPSVPRLTGFAVASRRRNREFHQLFRSVPEDDYLIEDYSCALQREIILAGRIYVSEGHICFSSNILGWVTTLVMSFDEIVAIEKESTAMVFPNAIAIQTLHARHIFRSLLGRESTYDLMVNIWKINHPAVQSTVNGTKVDHGTGDKTEKADDGAAAHDDSEEDEVYDEDEEGHAGDGTLDADDDGSFAGSSHSRTKGASAANSASRGTSPSGLADPKRGDKSAAAPGGGGVGGAEKKNYPGPETHAPTDYTDPVGRYDRVVNEDVIPAPLGKVYSLMFGADSGSFFSKFLANNQKCTELQFEGDRKGLTNERNIRRYSYIKPLVGNIGPKQTKCMCNENLDFLDLDKAVVVTLSTQTPDVPSGNIFITKTKYLLTWAPANQTHFLMTCSVEWLGKSWLKGETSICGNLLLATIVTDFDGLGPIEKGSFDGQVGFGAEYVKCLKAAVASRGGRASKQPGKRKSRQRDNAAIQEAAAASMAAAAAANAEKAASWGPLEPFYKIISPIVDLISPLLPRNIGFFVIGALVLVMIARMRPFGGSGDTCTSWSTPQRLAVYHELWQREESDLWNWLEDRVGMDDMSFPQFVQASESRKLRQRAHSRREVDGKLRDQKMSSREVAHAIRTTRERLDILEDVLGHKIGAE